ncbi:MAG: hypothetical protein LCI02_10020 [Proteobacteria bacterium]|nr:hypothetical protein [Pseudomonadota bacterium]
MQKKRFHPLAIAFALAAWSAGAGALGFGAAGTVATLGQSLDQTIALRLDPGETLAPECVSAEVLVGEQRLPAAAVRTRLESDGSATLLRVQTHSIIDEPVVTVAVSLGCPPRLQRRFTLLADPAPVQSAPALAAAVEPVPAAALASPAAGEALTAPARPRADATTPPAAARPTVRRPRPAPRRTAAAATPPAGEAAARAARPRLRLDAVEPPPPAASAAPAVGAEAAPASQAAQAPQPPQTAEAAAAASAAASAAEVQAAALAASSADARVAALEQVIEKMRADAAADRELLRLLRQKAAENDSMSAWTPWLAALAVLLAALALGLALRLRRLQRERQQAWWQATAAGKSTAAGAAAVSTGAAESRGDSGGGADASAPGALPSSGGYNSTRPATLGPVFATELPSVSSLIEPPPTVVEQTHALPVGWREEPPPRDVTIEELIDLEQQAEFFVVLGQDEAAIDLLVDHLRSTGGSSPLPYLKLLEIYRRRGDREAYERTRARFNHRFNAYAPDWEADSAEGRSLEDYPAVVGRLQMVWPSPIDAMAALESLLFRKSRGELFDMPAYRDVLFLYSLARDLLDREPLESGRVDVLLPIGDGADFTQPMSLDEMPPALDSGLVPLDNAPTVPVDLDVTQPQVPESLFGETATEPGVPGNGSGNGNGGGRRRR